MASPVSWGCRHRSPSIRPKTRAGLNASLGLPAGRNPCRAAWSADHTAQPGELRGLIGHEFTHFLLWQGWDGDLLVAAEMLAALTNDSRAHPAHFASWRLLKLYNEILCDRGALLVTEDLRAVVSMLVKVQTGVQEINPDSYLRQADEIFARGPAKTEGITHPEAFIRARAIKLWADNDPQATAAIAEMIEAGTDLQELDLLGQEAVAGWTRRVIDLLLSHKWFQTDPVVGHARLYFDDYSPPTRRLDRLQARPRRATGDQVGSRLLLLRAARLRLRRPRPGRAVAGGGPAQ